MDKRKILGNGLLLFVALIWGTAFVFQRVGMESIEPVTFSAARMALAAIAVGIVSILMNRKKQAQWDQAALKDQVGSREQVTSNNQVGSRNQAASDIKKYRKNTIIGGILCGTFLATASIFQQIGLVYTTAGKAGFITAMYMLLVPVIGFVFFRKKNGLLVWLSVLMGVIGMYFLCITEDFSLYHGDILVGLCALFFSFHILCCDYFAGRGNLLYISTIQFITATVISAVMAFILEKPSVEKVLSAAVPIVYCGIVSGGIGYTLQIVAQKYTEPAIASLLMSMESVFAVITGAVFLNEKMSSRELIGCIIMFIAIILVQTMPFLHKEDKK